MKSNTYGVCSAVLRTLSKPGFCLSSLSSAACSATVTALAFLTLFSTHSAVAESFKVGLIYPTTGPYKETGIAVARGAMMAVEEINANGGILGKQIELLTENTSSKPEKGVRVTNKLLDQGAQLMIGGVSSAVVITAAKEAAKRDVLYLSPHSYANPTTGSMGHTHIFRESYNAWMAGKAISFYINQMLTDKGVFYATADYSWGHSSESSLRAFTKTEDTQMHPGALIPFPRPRYRDIESVMYQARDSGAGVMVLTLAGDDLVTAMQIAHNLDLDKTMEIIVPGLTQDTVRVTGVGSLQGVISTVPWCWRLPTQFGNQKGIAFVEKYAQQHRVYPSSSAAAAYSLIYQYRDAAERANSTSSKAIIRALEGHTFTELKDQQTWRAFDHQSVQSVHVVKVKNRAEALKDPLREDYFDILLSIPGAMAARTESDWLAERQKAGVPGRLTSIK